MKSSFGSWISARVFVGMVAALGTASSVEAIVIDFNDSTSLARLCYLARGGIRVTAASGTFVVGKPSRASCPGNTIENDAYVEDNMLFFNGVNPEDPALESPPQPEYHLFFENTQVSIPTNPANQPRMLSPHGRGAVIQLTYDPNQDGVPDPFNLISLDVRNGRLNVGVRSNDFGIAVYNDLTQGFRWFLDDATNLNRVTLETVGDELFIIDNIVFEPVQPLVPLTTLSTTPEIPPAPLFSFVDKAPLAFHVANFAPLPQIDVLPGKNANIVNPFSQDALRVAILSTPGFDAGSIDPRSVRAGASAANCQDPGTLADIDYDGDRDLLLRFTTNRIGIQCKDVYLTLTGKTFAGQPFTSADFIRTTSCVDAAPAE